MTTHTPTKKHRGTTSDACAATPRDLHDFLAKAEAARTRQLESLPDSDLDPVTAAYRGSVERIREEVRTARRRLASGLYGLCAACGSTIASERLELRRWTTSCTRCAQRQRRP